MDQPRNVTPDGDSRTGRPDDLRQRQPRAGRDGPDWAAWGWSPGDARVPWAGILLVLVGGALLFRQLFPTLSFSTLFLVGLGLAFAGAWLLGRSRAAEVPAFIFLGLGTAPLLRDLGYVRGEGWTALSLGVALLLLWLVGQATRRPHDWAMWVGGVLALVGLAQASDQIPGFPDLGAIWPLVLIGVGLMIVFGGRLRRSSPGRGAPR